MKEYILALRKITNNKKKMKELENGKEPIHPMETRNAIYFGLSKREHFAALAMAALIASPNNELGYLMAKDIADKSIQYSDELLKQLEK